MLSAERRRSPRIVELDAQRNQQAKSHDKGKETYEQHIMGNGGQDIDTKRGRKKIKTRPVKDLIVNTIEQPLEAGTCSKADCDENAGNKAVMPSGAAMPETSKLEFLLDVLKRRDSHKFFAEPVDPTEVEHYYDIIEEPMDFGTITLKLNEGKYKTLQDFEYDVSLVSSNAMLFNASNTIYYRQARAIKELAQKLFHALKTDPENFETQFSVRRRVSMQRGRVQREFLHFGNSTSIIGTASNGPRDRARTEYLGVDRRNTYRPQSSFLNENESMMLKVFNDSKQLKLDEMNTTGYIESLTQFTKDLGPTAQMFAKRKVEECLKAASAISNYQLHLPRNQFPPAGLSTKKAIPASPSMEPLGNSSASQNFFLKYSGLGIGSSNGEKASTVDINTRDVCRLMDQASSSQTRADVKQKQIITCGSYWDSNLNEPLRSLGKNIAGGGITETVGSFQQNKVPAFGEGLDLSNAFKGITAHESRGMQLDYFPGFVLGDGNIDSAGVKSNCSTKNTSFSKMMQDALDMDTPIQTAEMGYSELAMPISVPQKFSGASSSSSQWPVRAVIEGWSKSQGIGTMGSGDSHSPGERVHLTEAVVDRGNQVLNWLKPEALGAQHNTGGWLQLKSTPGPELPLQPQDWVKNPAFGGGTNQIQTSTNKAGTTFTGNLEPSQVSNWCKEPDMGSLSNIHGWVQQQPRAVGTGFSEQSGPFQQPSWFLNPNSSGVPNQLQTLAKYRWEGTKLLGEAGPSQQPSWDINYSSGGGLPQIQAFSDGGRHDDNGKLELGVWASNWLKTTGLEPEPEPEPEPKVDGWLQQKPRPAGIGVSCESGPIQQRNWIVNPTTGGESCQHQTFAAGSIGNLEGKNQVPNWLKKKELAPQPSFDAFLQHKSRSEGMDLSGHQRTSQAGASQHQNWFVSSAYDGGAHHIQVTAAGEGSSYKNYLEPRSSTTNWF